MIIDRASTTGDQNEAIAQPQAADRGDATICVWPVILQGSAPELAVIRCSQSPSATFQALVQVNCRKGVIVRLTIKTRPK